jgi:hypothetical protein
MVIAAAVAILAVGGNTARDQLHPPAPDLPPAPWRATVSRAAVPPAFVAAWDRARNRADCALLFPLDGGTELQDAKATEGKTPDDKGWDIFLTGDAGTVEVLGLFEKSSQADAPSFTRSWADGSVAKYGPDQGNVGAGTDSSPFEAVLTLPDQDCAYRIYTTLGKAHLEFLFDRLRLMP